MRIQKGIVKYKQRDDIECMYCITDDGKQYYFLDASDQNKLKNGNRIVSTALVEAIDPMVKASNIGIINSDGKEVVPCVNKSIRPVDDNIVVVEIAEPVSQCVIDAISLRNDPLAATKLVSTTADVKDRLNSKMGTAGRFVFNDLFSEAGLYDIDGNPLVDGYYSFIALADRKLFLSKNNLDSEIVEYSIIPPEIQNNDLAQNSDEQIDVTSVDVPTDVVEGALNSYESEAVTGMNKDDVSEEIVTDNSTDVSIPTVSEDDPESSLEFDSNETSSLTSESGTDGQLEQGQANDSFEETVNSFTDGTDVPSVGYVGEEVSSASEGPSEEAVNSFTENADVPPVGYVGEDISSTSEGPSEEAVNSFTENADVPPVGYVGEDISSTSEGPSEEAVNSFTENAVPPVGYVGEEVPSTSEEPSEETVNSFTENAVPPVGYVGEEVSSTSEEPSEEVVNTLTERTDVEPVSHVEGDISSTSQKVSEDEKEEVTDDFTSDTTDSTNSPLADITDTSTDLDRGLFGTGISNDGYSNYDLDYQDDVFSNNFTPDTFEDYDEFDSDYVTGSMPAESYGMSDAANTLRAFIGQVRNDKAQLRDFERRAYQYEKQIHEYERQIASFDTYRRDTAAKLDLQQQKVNALNNKIRKSESIIMRYEDRLRDQEARLAEQAREISELEAQIKESDEVLKLMPVLKEIVGDEGMSDNEKNYRRVA